MNKVNGKDLQQTLKKFEIETGYTNHESLDYLFDNVKTADVLSWLCLYLDDSNIETCNEIQQYNELHRLERNLSKEYIENAYKANTIIPKVFEEDIHHIEALKRDIENARIQADNIEKLISKNLALDNKLNRNIQEEELNVQIACESRLPEVKKECLTKSFQIDSLHEKLIDSSQYFSNILTNFNKVKEKKFISQLPLNLYKQQCDRFQTNLHLWIKKVFQVPELFENSINVENVAQELNRLYFVIKESIIDHVKSESSQQELTSQLRYLRENSSIPLSQEEQRVQEIQLLSIINILHNDIEDMYETDLIQSCEKYSENLLNTILIENAEIKLKLHRDLLYSLEYLKSELIQALAQYELLFLLLKTDKIKLQSVNRFLEDLHFYSFNHSMRSNSISNRIDSSEPLEFSVADTITFLTGQYSSPAENIDLVLSELLKQKVSTENLENRLFVSQNQQFSSNAKQIEQKLSAAKKLIWCGPTLQPVIIPFEYLHTLNTANIQIEKIRNAAQTTKNYFISTQKHFEMDRWLKIRRQLWVWFLTKPDMIPIFIEQLKNHTIEQSKSNI